MQSTGLPRRLRGKASACRRHGLEPWSGKIPHAVEQLSPSVCQLLSRVRLCNPMNCSRPGSSAHGVFQARTLEWVAKLQRNYWACALWAREPQTLSPHAASTEAKVPSSQDSTSRGTTTMRSPHTATEKSSCSREDPAQPKINKNILKIKNI